MNKTNCNELSHSTESFHLKFNGCSLKGVELSIYIYAVVLDKSNKCCRSKDKGWKRLVNELVIRVFD